MNLVKEFTTLHNTCKKEVEPGEYAKIVRDTLHKVNSERPLLLINAITSYICSTDNDKLLTTIYRAVYDGE